VPKTLDEYEKKLKSFFHGLRVLQISQTATPAGELREVVYMITSSDHLLNLYKVTTRKRDEGWETSCIAPVIQLNHLYFD